MSTSLGEVKLGDVVFTKGIKRTEVITGVTTKDSKKSASGKGKHSGIVIGKTNTGLVLASTATFNHKEKLAGVVPQQSMHFWLPVKPATQESIYEPVDRTAGQSIPVWIYVRHCHIIEGNNWKVTVEKFSEEVVRMIKDLIDANEASAAEAARSASNPA